MIAEMLDYAGPVVVDDPHRPDRERVPDDPRRGPRINEIILGPGQEIRGL